MATSETFGRVTVFATPECENADTTVALLEEVSRELGITLLIQRVNVTSQVEAERSRCLGSPSVQIDGVDIDAAARLSKAYGFG